ncbi:MAG: class I SAM-dependent methyltransferase [Planctomycetota bacterium]
MPSTDSRPPAPAEGTPPDAPRTGYDRGRFEGSRRGRRMNRRERAVVGRYLAELPAGRLVLDVPAGEGRFTDLVVGHGHRSVSVDLDRERILRASVRLPSRRVPSVRADVARLPLGDDSVDAALCIRLLHHLEEEQILDVLRELRRVAHRACVTFYSSRSWRVLKRRIRGKRPRGKPRPARRLEELSRRAGWGSCRRRPAVSFLPSLQFLRLSR